MHLWSPSTPVGCYLHVLFVCFFFHAKHCALPLTNISNSTKCAEVDMWGVATSTVTSCSQSMSYLLCIKVWLCCVHVYNYCVGLPAQFCLGLLNVHWRHSWGTSVVGKPPLRQDSGDQKPSLVMETDASKQERRATSLGTWTWRIGHEWSPTWTSTTWTLQLLPHIGSDVNGHWVVLSPCCQGSLPRMAWRWQ